MPGARTADTPPEIAPPLLLDSSRVPTGDEWLHEVQLDGHRVMTHLEPGGARLTGPDGRDWTRRLPEIMMKAMS